MSDLVSWQRYGGYQVTSRGDQRFSAFYARLPDGRTIEQHYQCDVKGYCPGGTYWRAGKGKVPLRNISYKTQWEEYLSLWRQWAKGNENLLKELEQLILPHNQTLGDEFATSSINQAHALATLLNERKQI